MIDLDAIKARCDAATPGPWNLDSTDWPTKSPGGIKWIADSSVKEAVVWVTPEPWDWENEDSDEDETAQMVIDSTFIAAARTDVPALLDAVERLRDMVVDAQTEAEMQAAEVERLRSEVKVWEKLHDQAERLCARCARELDQQLRRVDL